MIDMHLQGLAPAQVDAVRIGLSRKLSIIFGGPGTGKTRTLASLMMCYAQLFKRPIWVAAPTAKAGARLMESLRALVFGSAPEASFEHASISKNPGLPSEALTIQRLLSRLPSKQALFRDHDEPFAQREMPGLLIIDEASMLSLELCEQVFTRLGLDCTLVLVGDPNQLHSVETGSVFAGLCEAQWPALQASRVLLTQNFRQSHRSQLSALADEVLSGTVQPSLFSDELALCKPDLSTLVELAAKRYSGFLLDAQNQSSRELSVPDRALSYLRAAGHYRLLSARRSGFAGADRISQEVLSRLKGLLRVGHQTWFEGRLITITKNDPASGLLNGDLGVCVIEPSGSSALEAQYVEEPRVLLAFERQGSVLTIPAAALPRFQDAYCLSVHQAQGSEFDHVDFIAAPAEHPLATRELLYTAVTRAKNSLSVWGDLGDLQWAASHPTVRHSRLGWRIDHPQA